MLLYYLIFTLIKKYPMIRSTPCNLNRENAQSSNRSTGTSTPEFMVYTSIQPVGCNQSYIVYHALVYVTIATSVWNNFHRPQEAVQETIGIAANIY